jgi:SAM-dependent methyltransferase
MDHAKFSTIAHAQHELCNPIEPATLEAATARLGLPGGSRVLDAGCGKAALLIRLAERDGAIGVGVDTNAAFLAAGRAEAARRGVKERITLHEVEAACFVSESGAFDLGICIGATHAFGGYGETLRALARWVRPGGHLLVGEGYWRRAPDPGYLALLGATSGDYLDHDGNVALGAGAGLAAAGAWESSLVDWDRYEDLYARTIEEYVVAHPEDPDTPAMRDRIRTWRDGYRRWGRDTLGFGLYLFRR